MSPLRIAPLGEAALVAELAAEGDLATAARAARLAARLRAGRLPAGVTDVVPAWSEVAVYFDPRRVARDVLVRALEAAAIDADHDPAPAGRLHEIPARYDGPDLAEVARAAGLAPGEVIARHAAVEYRVACLGFQPGFAYLGPLDPALARPRRSAPRPRVPAGSIAIAGAMTAIYPGGSPGGWHLIGHTDLVLFDPAAEPPARFAAGDRVRFVPVA